MSDLIEEGQRYRLTSKTGEEREGIACKIPQVFTWWASSGPGTGVELLFFNDPLDDDRFVVTRDSLQSVERI